jgi:hypothetical protein
MTQHRGFDFFEEGVVLPGLLGDDLQSRIDPAGDSGFQFSRDDFSTGAAKRIGDVRGEVSGEYGFAAADGPCVFEDVLEFADISGPSVCL